MGKAFWMGRGWGIGPVMGEIMGLQKDWPGWSRGSKGESVVSRVWKPRKGQSLQALLDGLRHFLLGTSISQ